MEVGAEVVSVALGVEILFERYTRAAGRIPQEATDGFKGFGCNDIV
jgi:hypothetical protein